MLSDASLVGYSDCYCTWSRCVTPSALYRGRCTFDAFALLVVVEGRGPLNFAECLIGVRALGQMPSACRFDGGTRLRRRPKKAVGASMTAWLGCGLFAHPIHTDAVMGEKHIVNMHDDRHLEGAADISVVTVWCTLLPAATTGIRSLPTSAISNRVLPEGGSQITRYQTRGKQGGNAVHSSGWRTLRCMKEWRLRRTIRIIVVLDVGGAVLVALLVRL